MRLVIAMIAAMAAGPAFGLDMPNLETRAGCLHTLGSKLRITQTPYADRGAHWRRIVEQAPPQVSENSAALVDLQARIWALELEFADLLMEFCQSYPAD